jgi:hypothetical protein
MDLISCRVLKYGRPAMKVGKTADPTQIMKLLIYYDNLMNI